MRNKILVTITLISILFFRSVFAGDFDCSVVYDEFDQLMMANFLVEPDRYVSTIGEKITRSEFLTQQLNRFKLREERVNAGIGIFKTNKNLSGKMIYFWQDNAWEERTPLVIDELIIFGRVRDGFAPVRSNAVYLTPGLAVYLDTSSVVPVDDEEADLIYEFTDTDYSIQAVFPAVLFFPVESMCTGQADPEAQS